MNEVADASKKAAKVHPFFGSVKSAAVASHEAIGRIAAAAPAQVDTAKEIADAVSAVPENTLLTDAELPLAANSALGLSASAETICHEIAASGIDTSHNEVRRVAQRATSRIGGLSA